MDSNLRGNIGAELAAFHDVTARPTLLAPAFPARGRTTVRGLVLIDGVPASETELAHDPQAPLRDSDIAALIQSQHPDLSVGRLPLEDVRAPSLDLPGRLEEFAVLVVDAETDADLDAIAKAALSLTPTPILAGSAGLAAAAARELLGPRPRADRVETCATRRQRPFTCPECRPAECGAPQARAEFRPNPVLAVLASSSGQLESQVSAAAEAGLDTIPVPCHALSWREEPIPQLGEAIARAIDAIRAGRQTIVHATGPLPDVPRPVDLVVEHLAHLAFVVIKQAAPGALLVGGGATAHAVLTALGARAIEVDEEPLPGIGAGLVVAGHFDGRPVVLKPGAAGDTNAVAELIHYLRGRSGAREAQA